MALHINSNFHAETKSWDVRVAGEIDILTAPQFRLELDRIFNETNGDICIYLDALDYIDSTGLGVIIGAYGRMKEKGFKIVLKQPNNSIEKLLHITSLDKIFL